MNRLKIILPFFIILLMIAACSPSLITKQNYQEKNYLLATADGGYEIHMTELYDFVYSTNLLKNGGVLDTLILKDALDSLIVDSLVGFETKFVNIDTNYSKTHMFRLRYYDFLIKRYMNYAIYDRVVIDSQQVLDYYYENQEMYRTEEMVDIYHILISQLALIESSDSLLYMNLSDEQLDSAAQVYTENLYNRLDSEESFKDAANKYSHDNKKQPDGDVGWTTRGTYIKPFDSVAYSLRDGEISKPYKDQEGWNLIYVKQYLSEGIHPIEEHIELYGQAHENLYNSLVNERGSVLFDSLLGNYEIVYNDTLLDGDVYQIDGQQWIAIVNGTDTIDCNEARSMELKVRSSQQITNSTAETKKEYLHYIGRKYLLLQAARTERLDTIPDIAATAEYLRHNNSRALIEPIIYDVSWSPSDSLIEDYYNANLDEYRNEKPYTVQHIIVEDSLFGEFLRDQAMSGVDFMELAMEHYPGEKSVRKELADLGPIGKSDVSIEFFAAAKITPKGEVSNPIKTEFGYHIIKVIDKKVTKSVDIARSSIVDILRKEHRRAKFEIYRDMVFERYNVQFVKQLQPVHLKPRHLR